MSDATILETVCHRRWPLPSSTWVGRQTWRDLLFAHWRVSRDALRQRVPSFLDIDTFDGEAWLGVVPFRITDSTARGLPAMPWLSEYNELNVRTYVIHDGIPGVYFFSLDADSAIAVAGGTALFNLPYYLAEMSCETNDGDRSIVFRSRRVGGGTAEFRAAYQPVGRTFEPDADTIDYWLTERYCLYTVDTLNRAYRVDIHHLPWQLQAADAAIDVNGMADAAGLRVASMPPLFHFSRRQDTLIWLPRELR